MGFKTKVLTFAPMHNTQGKSDATGAFQLGPAKFRKYMDGVWANLSPSGQTDPLCWKDIRLDNTLEYKTLGQELIRTIKEESFELCQEVIMAFFCHGWSRGFQFGVSCDSSQKEAVNFKEFVAVLHDQSASRLVMDESGSMVILRLAFFACSTGLYGSKKTMASRSGDNSFADRLRDELCCAGVVRNSVLAHYSRGDYLRNPDIVRFDGNGSPVGGCGGDFVIPPATTKFNMRMRRKYRELIQKDSSWAFDAIFSSIPTLQRRIIREMNKDE